MSEGFNGIFAETRSILHGKKTADSWSRLLRLLGSVFPAGGSSRELDASGFHEALEDRLVAELFPYLEEELDSSWPDELRVVQPTHHVELHRFGKILDIFAWEGPIRALCEAAGSSFGQKKLSKKMIEAVLPIWLRAENHQFEGVILRALSTQHELVVETLLARNFSKLRYLRFKQIFAPDRAKRGVEPEDRVKAVMHRILDEHAADLEVIGVEMANERESRMIWEPVMERAEELVSLRGLSFGEHEMFAEEDIFCELITLPAFDSVGTLTFHEGLTPRRAKTLVERAASKNLRAIGAGKQPAHWVDVREFSQHEHLANVEVWDIRQRERVEGDWESEEAAMWRDELSGARRDELSKAVVDLAPFDREFTHDVLFDEAGDLRTSTRMRALRISQITTAGICTIIEQGARAWPALECLVFVATPYTRGYDLDIEMIDAWGLSDLIEQLTFLDWNSEFCHPWYYHYGRLDRRSDEATTWRLTYYTHIIDGSMHPFMAFRAWRSFRNKIDTKPQAVEFAKMLGITGYSKKSRFQLLDDIDATLIELLGGRSALKLDGPTSAHLSISLPFEWRSPG